MVRFETLTTEKIYPYIKATAKAQYKNGVFGEVKDGVFETKADGKHVLMQIETGDKAKSDDFVVNEGEPVRVADLTKVNGESLSITKDELPTTYAKGNKLVSKADGTLKVDATAITYIEVTEVTSFGVNGKIVIGA